jgi:hypothetical protein
MRKIALIAISLSLAALVIWAAVPQTLSYQGVLRDADGDLVADGNYSLTFKLYTAPDGGTALWTETQPAVPVVNGIFNAILGSVTSLTLSFDEPYFLGVTVGGGSELTPRIPLTASAYSLRARSVADGQVVKSINSLKDDVILAAGDNITITQDANTLTVAAEIPGSWVEAPVDTAPFDTNCEYSWVMTGSWDNGARFYAGTVRGYRVSLIFGVGDKLYVEQANKTVTGGYIHAQGQPCTLYKRCSE